MQGYINGQPDLSWWRDQITAGIAFRKHLTHEAKWDTWRAYYRGNWRKGIMPKPLFFTMIRTVVPRIYFRNPSVSVVATKPGALNMAGAQVLERIDNKLIRSMRFKKQMKRMVQHAFMFGTGIGKLGFGAQYSPTPVEGGTYVPQVGMGANEFGSGIKGNMPWFRAVHPGDFIVPPHLETYEDSRWVVHQVRRPVADVRDDPRMKNVADLTSNTAGVKNWSMGIPGVMRPTPMLDLWEVRDRQTGKVFVFAPYLSGKKAMLFEDDSMQGDWGPPLYPVQFNEDDQYFWGVPDSQHLEPFQLELNETNTQIRLHRVMSLIKFMYQKGTMSESEIEKMMSGDITAIEVSDLNAFKWQDNGGIPPDLFVAKDQTMGDVREAIGFSRNQFGEYKPGSGDTTATEAQIVKMASEIRVDERRDMMADLMTYVISDVHKVIFEHWNEEQVLEISGPMGVPIWVKFRGEMLKHGNYEVKVDPDTSVPETKALREQKAVQTYGLLRTNPLIDPIKLTQYLLHEMHGVQFDDMLRMPNFGSAAGTAENPLSLGQFGELQKRIGNIAPQAIGG